MFQFFKYQMLIEDLVSSSYILVYSVWMTYASYSYVKPSEW